MPSTTVSVWLRPDPATRRTLRARIARLARRLGTQGFEPHLTLVGAAPGPLHRVRRLVKAFARGHPPLTIRLVRASHSTEFYRCVVLEAQADPRLAAHQWALAAALDAATTREFRPHLSLVYGRLPEGTRAAIARECAELAPLVFTARSIDVFDTRGPASGWRRLASIPLNG